MSIPGLMYLRMSDEFPKKLVPQTPEISTAVVGVAEGRARQVLQQMSSGLAQGSLRFWREEDENGVITVATNRVSVSHYKPYPSWEGLLPIILRAFNAYRDAASPTGLQRIGLRYINEIHFDVSDIDLEDYFDFYPILGPGLPQTMSSFSFTYDSFFNSDRDGLRLTMASRPPQQPDTLTVLLDLDYSLRKPLGVKLENVSEWLNSAHSQIENTFEGCLKASVRSKFDEESE